mgnify:CR=1 FL=1
MKIIENLELKYYNSYRVESVCKIAFFPKCEDDFIKIYKDFKAEEVIVIGGGYNIIFSKKHYEKPFVMVGESYAGLSIDSDGLIVCEAGVSTKVFSEFALANSLTGAEIFFDIPSSIGGAVVMNAGASGEEIKDILVKVRFLDLCDMTVKEIGKDEIGFDYRNSYFQKNTDKIVLKAWFKLNLGERSAIKSKMESIKEARWSKQPKDIPNAGSVFKRPKGYYVGAIIDDLGLKGFTIGGAKISDKHGGFIVNFNQAKGQDIIDIINHVKLLTKTKFNIDLEVEQRII